MRGIVFSEHNTFPEVIVFTGILIFALMFSASLVVLSLTFLTPCFSYIPKPTLSAVVICAVLFMVEVTMTKLIWKINSKFNNNPLFEHQINFFFRN